MDRQTNGQTDKQTDRQIFFSSLAAVAAKKWPTKQKT